MRGAPTLADAAPLRTIDVLTTSTSAIGIDALFLSPLVTAGLTRAGFAHPSPVQMQAIPLCRAGADVVVQAKSGTGKTCVFAVAMLELVVARMGRVSCSIGGGDALRDPLAVAVAPTREIAVQICDVVQLLGAPVLSALRSALGAGRTVDGGFLCSHFIGGLSVKADAKRLKRGCLIAVGTPGRLCDLTCTAEQVRRSGVEVAVGTWGRGLMRSGAVRMLVLDEADQLVDEFELELELLSGALPARKQVLAFSATFGGALVGAAQRLMRSPIVQRLCAESEAQRGGGTRRSGDGGAPSALVGGGADAGEGGDRVPTSSVVLHGVKQFYRHVVAPPTAAPASEAAAATAAAEAQATAKLDAVKELLETHQFEQCFVFCNDPLLGARCSAFLNREGWPAAAIAGSHAQSERMRVVRSMRAFRIRVLVSTDLTARGLDMAHVDLVVNLDVPRSPATYVHRVGRAGRFGGRGAVFSLVATPQEVHALERVALKLEARIFDGDDASGAPLGARGAPRDGGGVASRSRAAHRRCREGGGGADGGGEKRREEAHAVAAAAAAAAAGEGFAASASRAMPATKRAGATTPPQPSLRNRRPKELVKDTEGAEGAAAEAAATAKKDAAEENGEEEEEEEQSEAKEEEEEEAAAAAKQRAEPDAARTQSIEGDIYERWLLEYAV